MITVNVLVERKKKTELTKVEIDWTGRKVQLIKCQHFISSTFWVCIVLKSI